LVAQSDNLYVDAQEKTVELNPVMRALGVEKTPREVSRIVVWVLIATLLAMALAVVLVGPVMNMVGLQSLQP